jgi:DNA repair photolyase
MLSLTETAQDLTEPRPLVLHRLSSKSILNRMRLPPGRQFAEWSINPYRGCQHACAYCYARRTHVTFDMNGGEDFEREIFVKANAADVLREQLRRRRRVTWDKPVTIGSAVDPYQPVEGHQRITRSILEVLREFHVPVQIITKNTMVVRDIGILADIARASYCAVYLTITTMDAELARRMEPATPPPLKRFQAIQRLNACGVPAGVMLAPILPWITDAPGMLESVAIAARKHNAAWLTSCVLRLHPDVRPWFFDWLRVEQPDLLPRYERWYRYSDPPSDYHDRVHERIDIVRQALELPGGPPEYMNMRPVQGSLF